MKPQSLCLLLLATTLLLPACKATTDPQLDIRQIAIMVPDTVGVRQGVAVDVLVTDLAGVPIPGAEVELLSSRPEVASLDGEGRLTGHREGWTELIATSGDVADTVQVAVALSLLFAKQLATTGYMELFTTTWHGTALRNLTKYPYTDVGGAWSPDRRQIGFLSTRTNSGVILVMNDDGSNVREIDTGLATAYDLAWSPDGAKIAFAGRHEGWTDDIYVIGSDGSGLVPLTSNPEHERGPAWSPDGMRIAFGRTTSDNSDIHVMNADGSGVLKLTNSSANAFAPAWSPDGQRIAFIGNIVPGMNPGIHMMNADGSNLRRVGDPSGNMIQFDWSPEGDWFAYAAQVDGQWDLYLLPVYGGDPVKLTDDSLVEQDVRWR